MSVASHIELKRLRAQVTERVNSIRGKKLGYGFCMPGETKEQACIRMGRDPALANRISFFRWRTPQEQAAAEQRATPDWLREKPSSPTPHGPTPTAVVAYTDSEATEEVEVIPVPYAGQRIPYFRDRSII
jgi:hypothetical protein